MRGKRAITPIIAVLLLIVMTVGIAAFTFMWMQTFIQTLQTQTQYQLQQLQTQRPIFTINYATYDKNSNNISFMISSISDIPINTEELRVVVEEFSKVDNSFIRSVVMDGKPECRDNLLKPRESTVCSINIPEIDLINYNYKIIVFYRDFQPSSYLLRT